MARLLLCSSDAVGCPDSVVYLSSVLQEDVPRRPPGAVRHYFCSVPQGKALLCSLWPDIFLPELNRSSNIVRKWQIVDSSLTIQTKDILRY